MTPDTLAKPTEGGPATHEARSTSTTAANTPSITARSTTSDDFDGADEQFLSQLSSPPVRKSSLLTPKGSLRVSKAATRPQLQGHTTTAITRADIHGETQAEHSPSTSSPVSRAPSRKASFSKPPGPIRQISRFYNDPDDRASVRSNLSTAGSVNTAGGAEGLLGGLLSKDEAATWARDQPADTADDEPTEADIQKDQEFDTQYASEYVELDDLKAQGNTSESLHLAWSLKLKHFFILSSAGKPIWSRHGDDELISHSVGVIQTIISFYQGNNDTLKAFVAGDARFCILSKGHLFLVAVSRMGENDTQLRAQLEALYTQILSTLTLTNMEKMFLNRPSTDLRRPLQGTEGLLSALADGFTRGSPSTLLSALECLRLRKSDRTALNTHFAKSRAQNLLYGMLVTDTGQLVSVLRPKKHSLHPGDLQLIFNMLFEAKGIRAGGGENWIPLCLPGFNNTGFVYMYVSFLDIGGPSSSASSEAKEQSTTDENDNSRRSRQPPPPNPQPEQFCLVLISAYPDSFDSLRGMRNAFISSITGSTSSPTTPGPAPNPPPGSSLVTPLRNALTTPRLTLTTIAPGTPLQHFLYKSRTHVQFLQPAAPPSLSSPLAWRRLMSRYAALHGAVHARGGGRNQVVYTIGREGVGVAWATSKFEIYAVAERGVSRGAVARGVEMVVRWVGREEGRVFVVGGAVF